ncbi:MAG: hypothetical protein ABL998_01310, partial [Planctomycetota bacterium]
PADHPKAKLLARKRAAILDAARAVFLEAGYDGEEINTACSATYLQDFLSVAGSERVRWRVGDAERALALAQSRGLACKRVAADELELAADSPTLAEVAAWLAAAGIELREYRRERATLEEALLVRLGGERRT